MNIYEKLLEAQSRLKAPKNQYNPFGKYNYRNCEDILEAAKPICKELKAVVFLTDKIVMIGERYYVEATAKFIDVESTDEIIVTASAREEENRKGMDGSQITGASSSYARKYALNGLFDIDDTKDNDDINDGQGNKKPETNNGKNNNQKSKKQDVFTEINNAITVYSKQSGLATKAIVEHIEKQIGKKLDKSLSEKILNDVLNMIKSWSVEQ